MDEDIFEYSKDLNLLGRNIKRTVLIDNMTLAGWMQPNNQIMVEEYNPNLGRKDDEVLRDIIDLLKELNKLDDVRLTLSQRFGIEDSLR